jgi:hypothetical protein
MRQVEDHLLLISRTTSLVTPTVSWRPGTRTMTTRAVHLRSQSPHTGHSEEYAGWGIL